MKRKLSTALVMLLAFVLLIGTTAITASAAETTYQSIGGSTSFVKNLVVDADANIPNVTFSYAITRGDAVAATADTIEILVSDIGGGTIGEAAFSNADTTNTIAGLPTDENHSNPTSGKKYVQKSVSITLPTTSFTKPGVYRYKITEKTDNPLPGVTYDPDSIRYLDVFVVADESDVLHVQNYVFRKAATNIGLDGKYVSNPTEKSSGYINTLTQYDFDFSKTISGNQGDKNKRFNFTLNITGANPGTYAVETNDVTGNPATIVVETNGTATAVYSLTNGSTVKIIGLNAGAKCTVTEDPDDYTATHTLDAGGENSGPSSGAVTLDSDHSVAFTNARNGIIPTGIIMTIAPFAIGICVFGAVFIFIICRKKRRRY